MTTYNFCRRMDVETKILLDKWARRLEADEMTIHKDGSVTLMCKYGCICEDYKPTRSELLEKGCEDRRITRQLAEEMALAESLDC